MRWAELAGRRVPLGSASQYPIIAEGAEHRVYHDFAGRRAVKVTLRGQFGHSTYGSGYTATPFEYLSRLAWHNSLFGDDIRIVGVSYDEETHVEVVHSQRWITHHPRHPKPSAEEIDGYFSAFGFRRVGGAAAPLFYSEELDLVIGDAHDANIVRDEQGRLVAIDVVIGTPGPSVRAELGRQPEK